MSKGNNQAPSGAIKHNTYTGKELTGYLVGLAGQNIIYNIIAGGLQYYWQSIIFLPAMAISVIFFVARVWDAINDPMMGSIVDHTRTKWGKCKPYLMFVPIPIGIITILTFCNKTYTDYTSTGAHVLIIAWAAISYILWGMCYTVGDIPLWGVTSLMTDDENDRAKALSLARIVANLGAIGMLITFAGKALSPMFQEKKGLDLIHADKMSYIIIAVILTIFATILFQFSGFSVKERVQQSEKKYTMKENFKIAISNDPFRRLLLSGILRSPIMLLSIVGLSLVMYYFFDNNLANLVVDGQLQIIKIVQLLVMAIGLLGGMIIGTAATPKMSAKFGKKQLYNFYSIAGAVPYAMIFVVYKIAGGNLMQNMVYVVLMAVMMFAASWAMGSINILQSIMIADCVDYEEYKNGVRTDGVFFSGQSFITKLAMGVSSLISGFIYSAVHYTAKYIETLNLDLAAGKYHFYEANDGKYAMAMFLLISIPPAIGMLLSAIPTLKYSLTDAEHTRILNELIERRASKNNGNNDCLRQINKHGGAAHSGCTVFDMHKK